MAVKETQKVNALVGRGSTGERENAAACLERMMKEHSITDNEPKKNIIQLFWIRYKADYERRLLYQLTYMHTGPGHTADCIRKWTKHKRKEVQNRRYK